MPVIIGIPVYNDLESFKATMESIFDSTHTYDEIYIVESGSKDGSAEYCDWLQLNYPKVKVEHTKKEGPLKAYNRIFNYSIEKEADLLLSQTDVIYPKLYRRDWLKMFSLVANGSECSIVTCINGGNISGPDYINGMFWVGGWCTYIPYKTLKELKGFDEKFPNGYGVDIDLSYRASKLGPIVRVNYWVDHHMMNTREHDNDENTEQMKKEASLYFKKKWGLK